MRVYKYALSRPFGSKRRSASFKNQGGTEREAIDRGREVSRNQRSELFVHGRNGRIRERDSHGHDPNPPKGRSVACPHGAGPRKHRENEK